MRTSDLKNGDRVQTDGRRTGRIVGACSVFGEWRERKPAMLAAVELDEGFYSDDRQTFVSIILVHPDNLELFDDGKEG